MHRSDRISRGSRHEAARDAPPAGVPAARVSVAVTGAGGFIGRHVVSRLEERGVSPTLVLRPGSPLPDGWSNHNVVRMDIRDAPADAYERLGSPETLIHLAWGGLPNYASAHHLRDELPAQRSFLTRLIGDGLVGLTAAGTCFEYGMQSGALHESMPTEPVTAYGRAKDELRRELERLHRDRPFNLTWARLFYLHGTGQAASSLLPQLEAAIARGDGTFDMSGGEQLRDYLPVEAAAGYLVALALNGRDNGVVNVCSGRPVSVRDVVEGVVAKHRSSIALKLGRFPYPEHEPMEFWGDRTRLDSCIGTTDERI
jgi:nucleoside-diphosphate-sugar epimerase